MVLPIFSLPRLWLFLPEHLPCDLLAGCGDIVISPVRSYITFDLTNFAHEHVRSMEASRQAGRGFRPAVDALYPDRPPPWIVTDVKQADPLSPQPPPPGSRSLSLARSPPGDNTVELLKSLGADVVVTPVLMGNPEEYARAVAGLPLPRLGLNCVGGSIGTSVSDLRIPIVDFSVKVLFAGHSLSGGETYSCRTPWQQVSDGCACYW